MRGCEYPDGSRCYAGTFGLSAFMSVRTSIMNKAAATFDYHCDIRERLVCTFSFSAGKQLIQTNSALRSARPGELEGSANQ